MNFNRKFIKKDLIDLKKNGLIILPNFINKKNLTEINKEIKPWLKKISFNNSLSSAIWK